MVCSSGEQGMLVIGPDRSGEPPGHRKGRLRASNTRRDRVRPVDPSASVLAVLLALLVFVV
jgi:hypothetical protein